MLEEHVSLMVYAEPVRDPDELSLSETKGGPGAARGAVMGAIAGAITMTLIAIPVGLVGAGPLAVAALGSVAGGAWGALGAGLSGLGFARQGLDSLIERMVEGQVLVTVSGAYGGDDLDLNAIFRRNNAVDVQTAPIIAPPPG